MNRRSTRSSGEDRLFVPDPKSNIAAVKKLLSGSSGGRLKGDEAPFNFDGIPHHCSKPTVDFEQKSHRIKTKHETTEPKATKNDTRTMVCPYCQQEGHKTKRSIHCVKHQEWLEEHNAKKPKRDGENGP